MPATQEELAKPVRDSREPKGWITSGTCAHVHDRQLPPWFNGRRLSRREATVQIQTSMSYPATDERDVGRVRDTPLVVTGQTGEMPFLRGRAPSLLAPKSPGHEGRSWAPCPVKEPRREEGLDKKMNLLEPRAGGENGVKGPSPMMSRVRKGCPPLRMRLQGSLPRSSAPQAGPKGRTYPPSSTRAEEARGGQPTPREYSRGWTSSAKGQVYVRHVFFDEKIDPPQFSHSIRSGFGISGWPRNPPQRVVDPRLSRGKDVAKTGPGDEVPACPVEFEDLLAKCVVEFTRAQGSAKEGSCPSAGVDLASDFEVPSHHTLCREEDFGALRASKVSVRHANFPARSLEQQTVPASRLMILGMNRRCSWIVLVGITLGLLPPVPYPVVALKHLDGASPRCCVDDRPKRALLALRY